MNTIFEFFRESGDHLAVGVVASLLSALVFELISRIVTLRDRGKSRHKGLAVQVRDQKGRKVVVALTGDETPTEVEERLSKAAND